MSASSSATANRFRPEFLLFLLSPLLFAGNMLVARAIMGDFTPLTLSFLRWSVAGLVLLPFAWRGLCADLPRILSPRFALLALTGGVTAVAPLYAAASLTTAGNIALIISASPAFVLVAERLLFGVRLQTGSLLGIAMAAIGVTTVVTHGHPERLLALSLNGGDALAFGAMISWVAYTLLCKRRPVVLPPVVGLAALCFGAAAILLPAAVLELVRHAGQPDLGQHISVRSLSGLLFLCLVPSIGAYGSYQTLVRCFGPAKAAASMYIVPVYAVLLAAILLGEALHVYHGFGLALILGGVGLAALPRRRQVVATELVTGASAAARG